MTAPLPMSVEEYLNTVEYSIDPHYIPSDFALTFVNFIKMVNGGEGEENKTPVVHLKMLDNIATDIPRTTNLCSRGLAKTTLMAEYLILYLAVYGELPGLGEVSLGVYLSDSIENGVKNLRKNLEHRYYGSDFLQKYIPEIRMTDIRWEFTNVNGKKLVFKGYGAKTGLRGTKELGKRPNLAILDDLLSDEDARSPTIIEKIEDTVYKALTYALHPKKFKIIWSGTPFNAKDPLYKAVESGSWVTSVFPICETFPCTKAEFKGAWEDRFTYEYVREQYEVSLSTGQISSFNQELMLRIMSDEERLIPEDEILWYERRELLARKHNYNFYITTDFAVAGTQSNDFSVISVWAVNSNGDFFWVDGICVKQTMDRNMDDLFRLGQLYEPMGVGVETSGQQKGFIEWIRREMTIRNIFFTLSKEKGTSHVGMKSVKDKMSRFNLIVPHFRNGKIFFPIEKKDSKPIREAMEELRTASLAGFKSKHDDFIDTISMLASMDNIWLPAKVTPQTVQDDWDMWEDDDSPRMNRINSYVP